MVSFSRIACIALLLGAPAWGQTQTAAPGLGNSTSSGDLTLNASGLRLDANARGPARVASPQLDVAARSLALDKQGNQPVTQVRATGNVKFKLNVAPAKDAAPGAANGAPAHIEANCDSAVLTPKPLRLVLRGHLEGFYQIEGGAKNTLSGDTAIFTNPGGNLIANLTGGVTLSVPAQTLGQSGGVGATLGSVSITAQRAQINESAGTAIFAGNARAISSGGTDAFDIAAPRFTLTRLADGTISSIQTTGRTFVKLDLPPDPAAPSTSAATPGKISVGQPTHVEVAADGATLEPANAKRTASIATFQGNVKGFYRLVAAAAPNAAPGSSGPQDYNFVGTQAVIRYAQPPTGAVTGAQTPLARFNLEVSGAEIQGPPFDLNF